MAGEKLTDLTAVTSPNNSDLLYSVQDVATVPVSKKITWTVVKAFIKTYFDGLYQPLDTDLTSLAALGTDAGKIAYTTNPHVWADSNRTYNRLVVVVVVSK